MADLKPRQYKRLGRIQENNPERAARVAERMEKRASREERGKEVAKASSRGMAVGFAKQISRAEENPRAREEARKKINEFAKQSERFIKRTENGKSSNLEKAEAVKKMKETGKVKRPDTPLAASPVPSFLKNM